MGPLHCPLCVGLALLTMGRVAAHALLVQRISGWRLGRPGVLVLARA
jgi:hypothetical protein